MEVCYNIKGINNIIIIIIIIIAITVFPEPINIIMGSTAIFTCGGLNGVFFLWLVNGLSMHSQKNSHRGLGQTLDQFADTPYATLIVPGYYYNDNITIQCGMVAKNSNKGIILAESFVYLRIQGITIIITIMYLCYYYYYYCV